MCLNLLNVLIVEPYPIFGQALLKLLAEQERFQKNDWFITPTEIPNSLLQEYDVFILDVSTNPILTFSLIKLITKSRKAIVLTTDNSPDLGMARKCFFYNANGYIGKNVHFQEFEKALDTVINGERYLSNALRLDITNRLIEPCKRKDAHHAPTQREMEVLKLIVQEHSTNEIAQILFISKCTVESHRINLLQKLGVKNTAGLVREAVLLYRSEIML